MSLYIIKHDITKLQVDAIVNAANHSLLGGGGVDGAIHRAAGPRLLAECASLGGCKPGDAKLTNGYNLPAKFIIHAVGPVWCGGNHNEQELLASCYERSLSIAAELGLQSIAFPLISSGVYRFPRAEALKIAIETIENFIKNHPMTVIITLFGMSDEDFDLLLKDNLYFIDGEVMKNAHRTSENNKPDLAKDKVCGCFHCCRIYSPDMIKNWLDDTCGTALCPFCGVDSVIGENSGFPVTEDFLKRMNIFWFAKLS